MKLKVPRPRSLLFEMQIIERYRRRGSSVEKAFMEMYLAGVSMRQMKDISRRSTTTTTIRRRRLKL